MLKYYEQKSSKKEGKSSTFINGHILKQQLKENFKSFLVWIIIVAALMVVVLAFYPIVKDMYATMLSSLPPEMVDIFNAIGGNFENIAEYYVLEGGQIYVLVGAIYAAMLGIGLIKNEIKDGSAEFLYSQPVKRSTIFRSKLLALFINILLFNIIITAVSFVTMFIVEGAITFSIVNFLLYTLFSLIIHSQIGLIIFALAAILKKNMPMGLVLGFSIITYFLSIIAQIAAETEFLQYLTPFTYIVQGVMVNGLSVIDLPTLISWTALSVVLIFVAKCNFNKSDII
jgi:ABC-2 type transport system permease protein